MDLGEYAGAFDDSVFETDRPRAPPRTGHNGRVPEANDNPPQAPFQMFAQTSTSRGGGERFAADSLARIWDSSQTSKASQLFLSRANMDALQDAIRYRVYVETGGRHVIGRQSEVELGLVMRSVLLQSGRNKDDSGRGGTLKDVRALNAEVLAWCVPRIVSEVLQYINYRIDVSSLPMPMQRGGIATQKGSRSLSGPNLNL